MLGVGLHIIDVTNASRSLLLDLRSLQWSEPMLKFFGFRSSILPKLVSNSEVYGTIVKGNLTFPPFQLRHIVYAHEF